MVGVQLHSMKAAAGIVHCRRHALRCWEFCHTVVDQGSAKCALRPCRGVVPVAKACTANLFFGTRNTQGCVRSHLDMMPDMGCSNARAHVQVAA